MSGCDTHRRGDAERRAGSVFGRAGRRVTCERRLAEIRRSRGDDG
ncbi:hypothetical protein [Halegenticoccus soli]|nr:hypothetical protein [Halegenticoccus soli]